MSMDFEACLKVLASHRTDEVVVASMTPIAFWPYLSKSERDLLYTDPMGSVAPTALGIAVGRPEVRVWAFDGDGALLMYLGSLVSIGNAAPKNLVHFLFDNGMYGLVGLPTPGADRRDFRQIARGAGIPNVHQFSALEDLDSAMPTIKTAAGPQFVVLKVTSNISTERGGLHERLNTPECRQRFGRHGVQTLRRIFK